MKLQTIKGKSAVHNFLNSTSLIIFHSIFSKISFVFVSTMAMDSKFANLSEEKHIVLAHCWLKGIVDNGLLQTCPHHAWSTLPPKVVKLGGKDVLQVNAIHSGTLKKDCTACLGAISGNSGC